MTVRKGLTAQLSWTVAPYYAFDQSVTLTSSDASIASVDANGVVRGVNEGTAVITATTAQGHTCLLYTSLGEHRHLRGTVFGNSVVRKHDMFEQHCGFPRDIKLFCRIVYHCHAH